jgi:hypothetical protein
MNMWWGHDTHAYDHDWCMEWSRRSPTRVSKSTRRSKVDPGRVPKVEAKSNSSSSLVWSPGAVRNKTDAQVTYGVGFGRSIYGWKQNFIKHVCIPAFVLWLLLQVLETSPYRRGAVEIYIWHYYDHLFQVPSAFLRQRSVSSAALVFSLARWCKFHSLYIWCCRSRNLVRRLPFERDTFWNMQIYAYLWLYLFRIVHVFWIARGSVDVVSFCWRIKDVSLYDLQAYGPHTFFTTGFPRFLSIRGARGLQAFDFTSMH